MILGSPPSTQDMIKFIKKYRKVIIILSVYYIRSGMFIFDFFFENDKENILNMCPWFFDSWPFILTPWSPYLDIDNIRVSKILI